MTTQTPDTTETTPGPGRVADLLPAVIDATRARDAADDTLKAARAALQAAVVHVHELTGTVPTLRHPDATVSWVEPAPEVKVRDQAAYTAWVRTNHPDAPLVVDPAWAKTHLSVGVEVVATPQAVTVHDHTTGDEVAGVYLETGRRPYITVRQKR